MPELPDWLRARRHARATGGRVEDIELPCTHSYRWEDKGPNKRMGVCRKCGHVRWWTRPKSQRKG